MGKKKKKRRKNPYQGENSQARRRKKYRNKLIIAVVAGVLIAGGVYMLIASRQEKDVTVENSESMTSMVQDSNQPYEFRETRPILSYVQFVGRVSDTYRIAKEIPEVLDQLYCYCRCAENFGHKSLLSCYADKHAST